MDTGRLPRLPVGEKSGWLLIVYRWFVGILRVGLIWTKVVGDSCEAMIGSAARTCGMGFLRASGRIAGMWGPYFGPSKLGKVSCMHFKGTLLFC